MAYKKITIKINNDNLFLDSIVTTVPGKDGNLSKQEKQRYPIKAPNNNAPIFPLVEGTVYSAVLVVRQNNGEKYKISVENAASSNHPTIEKMLDDNFDAWHFTFVA
jgi:hypothetical protein